jgi:hypothetical protein
MNRSAPEYVEWQEVVLSEIELGFRGVQRDLQFFRQLVGIKRAACEIAAIHSNRRNLAPPVVHAQNKFLSFGILIHVDFTKRNPAFPQELFRSTAIAAPARAVDRNLRHFSVQSYNELDAPNAAEELGLFLV